ncbi:G1 family endopeptidase [Paenibacillus sp. KQZ6P-2]|uniref:G1 family endopeptidase n=1 Tax=Paenibacillus mangrovi TaxID=2931978 RepID=A0A9X1WQY4_9BACL|nr:G1 family glutamic endopeptidase [Paenibacillus mangrovi]MCJ8013747.1 G1 family endopeptidase [Paenibacillus mangrovi]
MNRSNRVCLLDRSNKSKLKGSGWISANWSGYANSGNSKSFRRISGKWTVPFVLPSSASSYSSAWIGIDGFRNTSLIQTGTGHDFVNGKPQYYAWWEILPDVMTLIPLTVKPGDRMSAVISKRKGSTWLITLRNTTQNWTFRTAKRYTGPQSSAEWIVEAPQVGAAISRMAHISAVTFTNCRLNGHNPKFTVAQRGTMSQKGITISIPGKPSSSGDAFVVRNTQRQAAGKVYLHKRP